MFGIFQTLFKAYWTRSGQYTNAGMIVRIVLMIVPGIKKAFKVFITIGKHVLTIQSTVQSLFDPLRKCSKAETIVLIVLMIVPSIFKAFKLYITLGIHVQILFKAYWIHVQLYNCKHESERVYF